MNKLRIACPDCRRGIKNGRKCPYCLGSGYDQNFEQDVADTFLSAHGEVLEELGEAPDAEGNWTVDQLDAAEAEIRRRLYRIAKAEEEE